MYCPKCGDVLADRTDSSAWDVYYCGRGDMWLSPRLADALRRRYAAGAEPAPAVPFDPQLHRTARAWYCPGCGRGLNERKECAACRTHIRDLVYQLVELHPHVDPAGRGWF
jgi:predicted RNA-binding Zn-ribbon protein involved in translation (DUF1610 family)